MLLVTWTPEELGITQFTGRAGDAAGNTAEELLAVTVVGAPTATPTPTNTPCTLLGDFNGDGVVDVEDIQEVASRWNTSVGDPDYDPLYDLDFDGDIDILDIMIVAAHWGETC